MEEYHYFYALLLPQPIKQYLHEKCEQLRDQFPFKRWVHPEDYHITLAFLGHASNDQLKSADVYIEEAIRHSKEFSLTLHQLGVFGKKDSPRIFWANTKESQRLNDIREAVYESCIKAGFQLDTRPFKPHITLARKWDSLETCQMKEMKDVRIESSSFLINHIVLYETHLDQTPKYVIKKKYSLANDVGQKED